ncbi:MAG TPA: DUF4832 domain-containing protein [Xanthomonadales bacterium]|nr:DUF4832 domain-containing protein [Xanthomonadales bacterium]
MRLKYQAALCGLALAWAATACAIEFTPARSSDDLGNPHKGWMLWGTTFALDGGVDNFHQARIFHVYAPWREIETSDQVFDWTGFEQHHLAPITAAYPDATFVLRIVADYPDSVASGINGWYLGGDPERDYPLFLEQPPLNIPASNYSSCGGDGPGRAPDWNHPAFATQSVQLIQALAVRFDGDPRISAIQVGVLGLWGEWHQSGCPSLEPGNAIKALLRDTYAAAFTHTRLQTRYARIPDAQGIEIGFHEDYFPSFTGSCARFAPPLPLCDDSGDWSLEWAMANATPESRDNWRTHPLSGESPLTSQKNVWISRSGDIEVLIRDYHLSFLGPAGKHEESGNDATLAQLRRALGYNLHLDRIDIGSGFASGSTLTISAAIGNSGSAPPYHRPRLRLSLLDGLGNTAWSGEFSGDLAQAMPGVPLLLTQSFALPASLPSGSYALRASLVDRSAGRPDSILQSAPRDAQGRVMVAVVSVVAGASVYANGFE